MEAIASWPKDGKSLWSTDEGISDEVVVSDSGLMRLELDVEEMSYISFRYDWTTFWESWLSQSSMVPEKPESKESFFVVDPPDLELRPTRRRNHPICHGETPAIYLFVYPLPMTIPELVLWDRGYTEAYFWSFDRNGQSKMSEEECEHWGIPELTAELHPFVRCSYLRSWPAHVYAALRKWQISRGFDPNTSDFARSLGIPELGRKDKGLPEPEDSEWEYVS